MQEKLAPSVLWPRRMAKLQSSQEGLEALAMPLSEALQGTQCLGFWIY